ncbi:MAG: zinc ribbon domain-containing protein [Planctomycetes bacterium]|nr:zinc ribbon domain-containing protein [Planctomycetota bacterium]
MPTYDYVCRECDHQWELFQPMKANPIRKCPECGRLAAKRLIGTGAGIIFRGSGFYQTDYRSKSYKEREKAEKRASETASSDGKSDGKAKSKSNSSKS